jgi:hypothetical protein
MSTVDNRIRPNSVDEALAAWDAGLEVETVEMGGMGKGYELAIQCVAFELMRALRDDPVLRAINEKVGDRDAFPPEFSRMLDELVSEMDAKQPDGSYKFGGLSGAQAGAAKSMAVNLTRHGWDNARRQVPDRMIFVRKGDPVVAYAAERSKSLNQSEGPEA